MAITLNTSRAKLAPLNSQLAVAALALALVIPAAPPAAQTADDVTPESAAAGQGFGGDDWIIFNTGNSDIPANWLNDIKIAADGVLWLGTDHSYAPGCGGLAAFDTIDWTAYNGTTIGIFELVNFCFVLDLDIDADGSVWIGSLEHGLLLFDGEDWNWYDVNNSDLPNNAVRAVAIDPENGVWAGTEAGLVHVDDEEMTVYTTQNSPLPVNHVDALLVDDDQLWIGTAGGGLVVYDGDAWTVYNSANSVLPSNFVNRLMKDDIDVVWAATSGGLVRLGVSEWDVYRPENSGIPTVFVHGLAFDAEGAVWVGTSGGLARFGGGDDWTVWNPSNSPLPTHMVRAIAVDEHDNKWIGTRGGLVAFNEEGVVIGTESAEPPAALQIVAAYPNPTADALHVEFTLHEPADVSIELVDLLGRRVGVVLDGEYAAGRLEVTLDAGNLASGTYVVRLVTGEQIAARRVTVVR